MRTSLSESSRHLVLRLESGERLPDALSAALREAGVAGGWIRGAGVLADVEMRALHADSGALASPRRVVGPLQLVTLDGTVGVSQGDLSVSLRAVLVKDDELGLTPLAGELVSARVVGLEVLVTVLDDLALGRAMDPRAGVWLIEGGERSEGRAPAAAAPAPASRAPAHSPAAAAPPGAPAPPSAWADAVQASAEAPPVQRPPTQAMPVRPARPVAPETEDQPFPDAGDIVEHFAFGRCEVLRSDGDRLHLKVGKDGRIREIALEMLRVTELESAEPSRRRFKLDRRI